MSFFKKKFGLESSDNEPSGRIRLSQDNVAMFPKYNNLLMNGKIKYDSLGRLRYLHGAPVGDLVLTRINKDSTAVYKESAEEWFDPDSQKAKDFVWL